MNENTSLNKVGASGILALDLFDYKPTIEIVEFDLKNLLFMEQIVKEKEFRALLDQLNMQSFKDKAVAFICSVDAIIPSWAYMCVADRFSDWALYCDYTSADEIMLRLWQTNFESADLSAFKGEKTVVKARPDIHPALYVMATTRLKPIVKTLMYGEVGLPKVIYKNKNHEGDNF